MTPNTITIQQTQALSQSQMLLWTGQKLHPDSPMYNMVMRFDLAGTIDVKAFQMAFQQLIQGSDVMRTIIVEKDNVPFQLVQELVNFELAYLDLSTDFIKETTFKNWLKKRSEQVFDLKNKTFDSALIKFSNTHFIWYFNQHHLVTDGWSLTVLYQKMVELYQLALTDSLENAINLPAFESYLTYEKSVREQPKKEAVAKYWKEKLANLSTPPRLYGESGKKGSSRSERVLVDLGLERSEKLRNLAKERDLRAFTLHMSMFNIFSTLLFVYLNRVSGQQNLAVGAPSHNRPTLNFKQTPGMFIEIFPMQAEVNSGDTFMDLFQRVRTEASQYLRNAQLGMSSPDLSRGFNVLLNYISGSFGNFGNIPMQSEWILPGHTDPEHHLRLQIHDFDNTGNIQLHFDMNTEVFDKKLQQRAPQHFLKILDHFLENRHQSLSDFDILEKEEKAHILKGLNDTKKLFFSENQHLLTLFEKQVEKTPNATAIIFENEQLTYQQFNEKANQIGHFIQKLGIGTDDVVAVCLERSMEMPLAIYGILKAGAAFLPIDPHHPKERLDFILKDANVKLVLTQKQFKNSLENGVSDILALDTDWSKMTLENKQNLNKNIAPNGLAYVIYTSGSTGKPKGVMVEHRSICNRLNWINEVVQIDKSDVYLQKTPYTFDVSVPEFFWTLQMGAKLVIARPEGHKNPSYLIETIQEYGITTIHFVPSMLSVFLEEKELEKCATLRRVFTSGEAISMTLQNRFFEYFDVDLYNLYGPTEAAVEVTQWRCRPNDDGQIVPIGMPVANTHIYILDKKLQPVPIGVPGELYIAGIQVARGYLNRPKLTAERFVNDPFSEISGAKMYRSGDLARHRKDGAIEYLGRVDFQIKLRGFRIELGEIEARLEGYEAVTQAVVILYKGENGERQLIAYYTGEKIDFDSTFINYLAIHLPAYMIPAQFIYLKKFPLGSSGKVDRKRLPKVDVKARISAKAEYVAPRNEIEELLVEIWSEILQIERIGVFDNFFEMGGHSLTAIRLVSRVIEAFELTLPINLVFEKPTIAAYSEHIEATILQLMEEMDLEENEMAE